MKLRVVYLRLTALTLLVVVLASCSERHGRYSEFGTISAEGWLYGDTVSICATGLDSAATRRIEVAVRHTNDYPYRNLWLEISYRLRQPADTSAVGGRRTVKTVTVRDTVQMMLADVYGRWLGKGFGPSYQMSSRLRSRFSLPDSTVINVRHIMRTDTLPGIDKVGLIIESDSNP